MTIKAIKPNKLIAAILLFTVLGGESVFGFTIPRRAYAQAPAPQPVFVTGGKLDVTVLDVTAETKSSILNVIAKSTVQMLQAIFLRSLADWVRSGYKGKPQFVANPEQYFKQLAGAAILNTQIQLLSTRMCAPFGQGPTGGVAINVPSLGGYPELECTLSHPNVQDFYDKFENGGWTTWREISQPQNNDIGMLLLVADATSREVSNSYAHGNREVLASQGFLGIKNCALNVAFSAAVLGQQYTSNQCAQYSNVTPGGIVAAKIEKALLQDIDTWVNVHELSDLIAAFINTALNKLIGARFFCLDCTGAVAQSGLTVGVGGGLRVTCSQNPNPAVVGQVVILRATATASDANQVPTLPNTYTFSGSLFEEPVKTTGGQVNYTPTAADAGKTLPYTVNVIDSSSPALAGSASCAIQVGGTTSTGEPTCASTGCPSGSANTVCVNSNSCVLSTSCTISACGSCITCP